MKKIIVKVEEKSGSTYELFADLIEGKTHDCLRFSSVWTGAKRPEEEQCKFETFLTPSGKAALINLLQGS